MAIQLSVYGTPEEIAALVLAIQERRYDFESIGATLAAKGYGKPDNPLFSVLLQNHRMEKAASAQLENSDV